MDPKKEVTWLQTRQGGKPLHRARKMVLDQFRSQCLPKPSQNEMHRSLPRASDWSGLFWLLTPAPTSVPMSVPSLPGNLSHPGLWPPAFQSAQRRDQPLNFPTPGNSFHLNQKPSLFCRTGKGGAGSKPAGLWMHVTENQGRKPPPTPLCQLQAQEQVQGHFSSLSSASFSQPCPSSVSSSECHQAPIPACSVAVVHSRHSGARRDLVVPRGLPPPLPSGPLQLPCT